MNQSDSPRKIVFPFASQAGGAYVHSVPDAGATSDTKASWQQGFPPKTFTPVASGGSPVDGADMNGVLAELSAIARWAQDGGLFPYDAAYANAVGGYRKGAMLQSSVTAGLMWQSTADANMTNPDASGAQNWIALGTTKLSLQSNGYRVCADGFTEQWGGTATPAGGSTFVTFPIAFSNACLNVQATNNAGAAPSAWPGVGGLTTTGFTIYSATASGVAPMQAGTSFSWRAIGY
jgi:hypothetical protein